MTAKLHMLRYIKEKLQSGDYSLDEYIFKLYEQVDGVQKLTSFLAVY